MMMVIEAEDREVREGEKWLCVNVQAVESEAN